MKQGKYENLAQEVGKLVDSKNKSYGNSFREVGKFVKILYPDGVRPEQYTDLLYIVRIFDKLKRIATKRDAFGEDPIKDLFGILIRWIENNPSST